MKLAIYRAIKCGTEYNARKPPTIVAFVIIIGAEHRVFSCRHPNATNFSESCRTLLNSRSTALTAHFRWNTASPFEFLSFAAREALAGMSLGRTPNGLLRATHARAGAVPRRR